MQYSNWDWYPENSWPNDKGVASWRWVLPTLTIFLNWETFFFNSLFKSSRDGNNLFLVSIAMAICIAVGKTSLVDWDLLTWSLGWTGFFEPFFPPKISIALLAITSLTFMFVCVPEPVCQTFRGKWSFNFPLITSLDALTIALEIVGIICLSFLWTMAAAFLIIAIDLINLGLTKNSPMSKNFFDLWVDAPQYLSFGTFIDPILSNSLRNFIDSLKLFIY